MRGEIQHQLVIDAILPRAVPAPGAIISFTFEHVEIITHRSLPGSTSSIC